MKQTRSALRKRILVKAPRMPPARQSRNQVGVTTDDTDFTDKTHFRVFRVFRG
jgi:hypothetical protein